MAVSPVTVIAGDVIVSPTVLAMRSGRTCKALYGFSDKAPYDVFRASSETPLTPFPLVKVYLRTLIETGPDDLHLVILDAAGPSFQIHDPGTWPAQARLADQGKWEELKQLQDELKGGKV